MKPHPSRSAAIAAFRRQQNKNRKAYHWRRKILRIRITTKGLREAVRVLRKLQKRLLDLHQVMERRRLMAEANRLSIITGPDGSLCYTPASTC